MPEIPPEGKVTDPKYHWMEELDVLQLVDKAPILPENKELLRRFIHDARMGKTILKGAKKRVGKARQIKYLQDLKKLDTYFQKPLDQVTQADMESFILALEDGRLKKDSGEPYATETQVAIKKIIIKFYKWLNGGEVPAIVSWIDTSYEIKDYSAINKEQVDAMVKVVLSNTPETLLRNKAILMFLFDSGCRADELLNIRLKHLSFENGNYKTRIEFSKTTKRTITLPMSKLYLDAWLDVHPLRENPLAQLFPITYSSLKHLVERAGNRIGVKLTPHGMRHASATYWARHLSQYQLCYRFGWSMSSRQPQRYIDREGLNQEKVVEIIETNQLQKISNENAHLNKRLAMLEEQLEQLLKTDKEELLRIINLCKQKMNEKK